MSTGGASYPDALEQARIMHRKFQSRGLEIADYDPEDYVDLIDPDKPTAVNMKRVAEEFYEASLGE